ncbi:unnamed protein product [Darwinula stevensoni]|uniref:C-type lectin domain-containing protein n=1 Tax=Darwinula stevensoni TaxID=69355 RepID=A0A7R8X9H2_9CRUS|nr:unnamed protein product [Darwinula stevensoni]CAG0891092.1 unnamed protein product [Darwinula stevensoni]
MIGFIRKPKIVFGQLWHSCVPTPPVRHRNRLIRIRSERSRKTNGRERCPSLAGRGSTADAQYRCRGNPTGARRSSRTEYTEVIGVDSGQSHRNSSVVTVSESFSRPNPYAHRNPIRKRHCGGFAGDDLSDEGPGTSRGVEAGDSKGGEFPRRVVLARDRTGVGHETDDLQRHRRRERHDRESPRDPPRLEYRHLRGCLPQVNLPRGNFLAGWTYGKLIRFYDRKERELPGVFSRDSAQHNENLIPPSYAFAMITTKIHFLKNLDTRMNFSTGVAACQPDEANLVQDDKGVAWHNFILQYATSKIGATSNFWLGGNDLDGNRVYYWNDGTPVSGQTFWYPGQPSFIFNGIPEQCMELRWTLPSAPSTFIDKWNDARCSDVKAVFCEFRLP